ncbi:MULTISPECIES: single-stranded DNA-binding protein [Sorangium]|uniref:Single-stranded DNA-binding protein n=1 Tax=Sorangium cellulosum TaxID=56 RepID=A0A4P2QSC7_SORCE|nr:MULTISPECIES: single-stranded DNA-binding protein [Sorangium]AUX33180.1 single-stranded DNA-binding protein [Sorangium cellulosum]AUX33237.1 single-stranded DNA-binding protein [Sorangium cellulosum]WCQ92556.1 Single-stranded DNA-binding protein [Sorangium sp. Soce836]
MAEGLNRVLVMGNLGADPELRFTQGGAAVLNMRIAVTESYLDRDKVRKERTEWVNAVVWGARAEGLKKVLGKGSRLLVEGSLRTSSYDDRDGNKRYKTEVVANNVVLCGGGQSGGNGGGQGSGEQRGRGQPQGGAPPDDFGGGYGGGYGGGDDDIPF